MCGISGIFSRDPKPPDHRALGLMNSLLSHRGPDGEGLEFVHSLAFGHRRLSIIDLEGGKQPMYSGDGSLLITYNGEIYNYVELKRELESHGHVFRTASDTEVILEAFKKWGESSFEKLNGQFAFGLYRLTDRTLYLVRDRMGEKPLFYASLKSSLVFASEIKSILSYMHSAEMRPELEPEAINHFFSLNYVPFEQSFVKGVVGVSPGSFLRICGDQVTKQSFGALAAVQLNNPQSQLESAVRHSAQLRIRSDVPVGLFLSGGIDSTVVAWALQQENVSLTAYSANFIESGFSELENARTVCRNLNINHEVVDIIPSHENISELIQALVWHGDTPLADSSSLAVFLLSRETRRRVKVVLSGDGGDELFGGYLTYRATALLSDLTRRLPGPILRGLPLLAGLVRRINFSNDKVGTLERLERFLRNADLPPALAHFAWNGMFRQSEKERLLHADFVRGLTDTFESLAHGLDRFNPSLRSLMLADQRNYLPSDILVKVDRMSMAHGLEVRSVFLDPSIVSLSRVLADSFLIKGGASSTAPGKEILRDILGRNAPWYPSTSPKKGFSIPIHLWFRTILKSFFEDIISSRWAVEAGIFNQDHIHRLWRDHQRRRRNIGFELWGIMVALLWYRKFIGGRVDV